MIMKRLVVFAVAFAVTGCTAKGVYGTNILKEEYETDYASVYAEIAEFSGLENREYQSELNASIQEWVSETIKKFDSLAQDMTGKMPKGVKSALHITQDIKRNRDGIISFVEEQYIYLGGAHGNVSRYPRTVNARAEKPHDMKLSELFADDRYKEEVERQIDLLIEKNPEKYNEFWAEPHIEETTAYYVTDEELVIFFAPYELSYYAKGFIEFPIRFSEISGYLKEEYR